MLSAEKQIPILVNKIEQVESYKEMAKALGLTNFPDPILGKILIGTNAHSDKNSVDTVLLDALEDHLPFVDMACMNLKNENVTILERCNTFINKSGMADRYKPKVITGHIDVKAITEENKEHPVNELEIKDTYMDDLAEDSIVIGAVYQHFKGGYYSIVALAKNSETLDIEVIYRNLETRIAYSRKLSNFLEHVKVNDKEVPRFKFIHNPI